MVACQNNCEIKCFGSTGSHEVAKETDGKSHLQLDAPLPVIGPSRVRIIVLFPEKAHEEIEELEWLCAAATNPAFDFLKDSEEDIYTLADGRPFDDKG